MPSSDQGFSNHETQSKLVVSIVRTHFACGVKAYFPSCKRISHAEQTRSFLRATALHTRCKCVLSFMRRVSHEERTRSFLRANAFHMRSERVLSSCKRVSHEEQTCSFHRANMFHTWSKHVLVIVHTHFGWTANALACEMPCNLCLKGTVGISAIDSSSPVS